MNERMKDDRAVRGHWQIELEGEERKSRKF